MKRCVSWLGSPKRSRLKEANREFGLICAVSGHESATVAHVIKHDSKRSPALAKRVFQLRLETEGKAEPPATKPERRE